MPALKAIQKAMTRSRRRKLSAASVLACVCLLCVLLLRPAGKGGKPRAVEIYLNGSLYGTYAWEPGNTVEVRQDGGKVNVIRMTDGGFEMQEATCPNQDCVRQGEVTAENASRRALGNRVICLPNRVEVRLILDENETGIPDA